MLQYYLPERASSKTTNSRAGQRHAHHSTGYGGVAGETERSGDCGHWSVDDS